MFRCLGIVALLPTFCLLAPTTAEAEFIPSLLQLVSTTREANVALLNTWEGKASIRADTRMPDGTWVLTEELATFAIENSTGRKIWLIDTRSYESNLVVEPGVEGTTRGVLIKDNRTYTFQPGETRDTILRNTLVVKPRDTFRVQPLGPHFDPMSYFTLRESNLKKKITFVLENMENDGVVLGSTVRNGDLVEWKLETDRTMNKYVFDLNQGGNLVKYEGLDDMVHTSADWTYINVNEVWVPSTFKLTNSTFAANVAEATLKREVTFEEMRVNVPIPEAEFSLSSLGVTAGTLVTDHVAGASYRFEEGLQTLE